MKKIISRIIEAIISPFYGRKRYQSFFGALYHISLRGMNFRNANHTNNGERFLADKIAEFYKSRQVGKIFIFDIGANVGNYTQLLCDTFLQNKIDFKIYCFEPLPAAFKQLKSRFENQNYVEPLNFGVGKNDETISLHTNDKFSELASVYKKDFKYVDIDLNIPIPVKIINLDRFLKQNNFSKVHFLKLDVEGSEYDIVKSAPQATKDADFIQFEFGTSNVDSRTYLKDFFEIFSPDFKIYRILKDGMYPCEYHPDYEIAVLCNYLAVSKKINDFLA